MGVRVLRGDQYVHMLAAAFQAAVSRRAQPQAGDTGASITIAVRRAFSPGACRRRMHGAPVHSLAARGCARFWHRRVRLRAAAADAGGEPASVEEVCKEICWGGGWLVGCWLLVVGWLRGFWAISAVRGRWLLACTGLKKRSRSVRVSIADPVETPGCFADRKNDIDAPLHIADGGSLVASISSRKPTNSTYETRESS